MVLYRKELCATKLTTNAVTELEIFPGKSGLSTLDSIAQTYEEFKVIQWSATIVPTVGTNSSGSYTCGYSYASSNRPRTQVGVAALSPATSKPIYSQATLAVNARKVMGRPWMPTSNKDSTSSPGALCVYTTKDDALMVWVTYKVLFNGPTAVKRNAFDDLYKYDIRTKNWTTEDGTVVDRLDYDQPVNMQLDIGTGDLNRATAIYNQIQQAFGTLMQVHSLFNSLIAFAHYVGNAMVGILPAVGVPVIMHVQRRPFLPILQQLIELGYRPLETIGPSVAGGEQGLARDIGEASEYYRFPSLENLRVD